MLLTIDVGNTHTVLGLFEGEEVIEHWRINTDARRTADEIAPGIEISVDALSSRGAQLHKIELVRPRNVIAKNTVEALQSGIIFGFAGQVDGVVERMSDELADNAEDITVVATGGLAAL